MSFGTVSFIQAIIFEVENASPSPKSVMVNFVYQNGRNSRTEKIQRYKTIKMDTKNNAFLPKVALALKSIELAYNFTSADVGINTIVNYSIDDITNLNIKTTDTGIVQVRVFDKGACHIIKGGKIYRFQAEKEEDEHWPMSTRRHD